MDMLVKLQHLDTTGFCILGTSKIPTIKPSPVKVEFKKQGQFKNVEIPNGSGRRLPWVYRKPAEQKQFDQDSNFSIPVGNCRNLNGGNGKCAEGVVYGERNVEIGGGGGGGGGSVVVRKVHTKCSTKWPAYGGAIPAILQALDCVQD